MIEIIQPAPRKYKCTCARCGCYFSYELEDLHKKIASIGDGVYCPNCQEFCTHQTPVSETVARATTNATLTI